MPFFTMKNQVWHNFLFDTFTLPRGCLCARTARAAFPCLRTSALLFYGIVCAAKPRGVEKRFG